MKDIKIELPLLQDFLETEKVLFARTNTKQIQITLRGNIEIWVKEEKQSWKQAELYWQGIQPYSVLEKYNDLP